MNKQRNHMQDDNQQQDTMNHLINKSTNNTNLILIVNKEIDKSDLKLNKFKLNHLNKITSDQNDHQLSPVSEIIADLNSSKLSLNDKRNFASG